MGNREFISEVRIRLSIDPDGRFRAHIYDPEHMALGRFSSRERSINSAIEDAREVLRTDNFGKFPGGPPRRVEKLSDSGMETTGYGEPDPGEDKRPEKAKPR